MDNLVTVSQLINVSSAIEDNATKNKEHNEILDDYICRQYDVIECKKQLEKLFTSFKSARYLYSFPVEDSIKISANYEFKETFGHRNIISQVEQAVTNNCDKRILTTDIYYSILNVSEKLTGFEAIYLINTFITHKSEDDIASLIDMSKTYLQKIKRSCIVKMWIELKKYCYEDD